MISPPLNEAVADASGKANRGWTAWFTQVANILPWSSASQGSASLNFPNIAAGSQQALTVAVKGAKVGGSVSVVPTSNVPGVLFNGFVIADNAVTVYASNITSGSIDPAAQTFNITVLN